MRRTPSVGMRLWWLVVILCAAVSLALTPRISEAQGSASPPSMSDGTNPDPPANGGGKRPPCGGASAMLPTFPGRSALAAVGTAPFGETRERLQIVREATAIAERLQVLSASCETGIAPGPWNQLVRREQRLRTLLLAAIGEVRHGNLRDDQREAAFRALEPLVDAVNALKLALALPRRAG